LPNLADGKLNVANLSYASKKHSVLAHTLKQMKCYEDIVDILEDYVEHIHQISANIETCTSRIYSKIDAIQSCQEIKA
jgi:hypothetical protein